MEKAGTDLTVIRPIEQEGDVREDAPTEYELHAFGGTEVALRVRADGREDIAHARRCEGVRAHALELRDRHVLVRGAVELGDVRLDDDRQLDLTFVMPAASVPAFITASGLPQPVAEGGGVAMHGPGDVVTSADGAIPREQVPAAMMRP